MFALSQSMDFEGRVQLAEIDFGNLLYQDPAAIDTKDANKRYIKKLTLSCMQHFMREFYKLPTEADEGVTLSIANPIFSLPRAKPAPTMKELTRWERFAQVKGVKKRKKSRKVWDDVSQSWKPRWGKGRIDSIKDKWVLEVPGNADPYEDQFEKLAKARSERKAKNEFARLKNIARTVKKGQAPPIGVITGAEDSKNVLNRALEITKRSDASLGRFSQEVNERKIARKTEKKANKGKLAKTGPSRHKKGGKGRGRLPTK